MTDSNLPKIKIFNLTILFKYKSSSSYEFLETEDIEFSDSMVLNTYSLYYGNGARIFNISFEKGDVDDYQYKQCKKNLTKGSTEDCDTDQFLNYNAEQTSILTLPRPVSDVSNIFIKYQREGDLNQYEHSYQIRNISKPILLYTNENNSFVVKEIN